MGQNCENELSRCFGVDVCRREHAWLYMCVGARVCPSLGVYLLVYRRTLSAIYTRADNEGRVREWS